MENSNGVYVIQNLTESEGDVVFYKVGNTGRNLLGLLPVLLLILLVILRISWTLLRSFGQKTRSQQPSRMYAGTRAPRDSLGPPPTVYVSPSNFPPPPKYDFAPPSYEEVVGVHYPQYSAQPISQPISAALANQTAAAPANQTPLQGPSQPVTDVTSVTVVNESQRTSVTVART